MKTARFLRYFIPRFGLAPPLRETSRCKLAVSQLTTRLSFALSSPLDGLVIDRQSAGKWAGSPSSVSRNRSDAECFSVTIFQEDRHQTECFMMAKSVLSRVMQNKFDDVIQVRPALADDSCNLSPSMRSRRG